MAQTIKLKRSSVAGKVPTTGQLEIGELALNSADGKVYFERGDTTVQSFFTTNALITGSLQQSGSDSYFLSNVGIGTDSPAYKLDVNGNFRADGGTTSLTVNNSSVEVTGGYLFAAKSSGVGFYVQSNSVFRGLIRSDTSGGNTLRLGDTSEVMTITGGNVGIGTATPDVELHIAGTNPELRITPASSGQSSTLALYRTTGAGSLIRSIEILANDNALDTTAATIRTTDGSNTPALHFETANGSASHIGFSPQGDEAVRITNTGNVGIGTKTPEAKLHVSGSSDVLLVEGSGSTSNTTLLAVDGNNGRLFEVSDDLSDSLFSVNTIAGLPVFEVFADNRIIAGAFNQNDFVISGSRVGIGTATPQEKLHIVGNISGSDTYINDWGSVSASLALISGSATSQTLQQVTDNGATTDNSITILGAANNFKGLLADTDINLTFGSTAGAQPRMYFYGTTNGQANAGDIFMGTANNTGTITMNGDVSVGGKLIHATELYIEAGTNIRNEATIHTWANAAGTTEYGRFDSSGRLLLGTNTNYLGDKLQVVGTAYTTSGWRVGTATTYVGKLYNNSGILSLEADGTRDIQIGNSTTDTAMIFVEGANGKVGIGTSTPPQELTVEGSISASGALYDNVGSAGTSGQMIQSTGTGYIWTDNVAESAQDLVIQGKNLSGGDIQKGTPLYFTGSGTSGNIVGVYPADAGNPDRMPAGGVAAQDLANEEEGNIYIYGFINGVNTSAFNAGDDVFVAVGGGYTNVKPTGSALIQKLGNVEKSAVNGSGVIQGPSWYNDLPNWEEGKIVVGQSDSQPVTSSFVYLDEDNQRFGIGTTSPSEKLDVSGSINISEQNGQLKWLGTTILRNSGTYTVLHTPEGVSSIYIGDSGDAGNYYDNSRHRFRSAGGGTIYGQWDVNGLMVGGAGATQTLHVTGSDANFGIRIDRAGFDQYDLRHTDGGLTVFNVTDGRKELNFNGNGNIGIGLSAADSELHIEANTPIITLEGNSTSYINAGLQLIANGATNTRGLGMFMYQSGSQVEWFSGQPYTDADSFIIGRRSSATAGSHLSGPNGITAQNTYALFKIDNAGNVGIGTTNPQTPLHVEGLVRITEGGNTAFYSGDYVRLFNSQTYRFRNTTGTTVAAINLSGNSYFNGGNVGIGTTSPSEKLDVEGNIKLSGTAANKIYFERYSLGSNVGAIGWHTDGVFYVGGHPSYGPTAGSLVRVYGFGSDIRLGDSVNGDVLTVDASSGNVGIGTTGPSYKLDVAGTGNYTGNLTLSGSLDLRGGAVGDVDLRNGRAITFYGDGDFRHALMSRTETGGSTGDDIRLNSYAAIYLNLDSNNNNDSSADFRIGRHGDGTDTISDWLFTVNGEGNGVTVDQGDFTVTSGTGSFNGGLVVTGSILHDGDLTVTGIVTAQEFHTEFVSASIVYQSGSTKFGDTTDDVHQRTGSLEVSGSTRIEGNLQFSGSHFITTTGGSDSLTVVPDGVLNLGTVSTDHTYIGASARPVTIQSLNTSLNAAGAILQFTDDTATSIIRAADALVIETDYDNDDAGGKDITFKTSTSTRMTIKGEGQVVIGNSTTPLTTGGTGSLSVIGNRFGFGLSNTDMSYLRRIASGRFQWQTFDGGNTGEIHLQPYGGNVGIGTTAPDTKLHIEGGSLLIDAYSVGESEGIFFREGFITSGSGAHNLSITTKDWNSSGASADGLLINAFDGIGLYTGNNAYTDANVRLYVHRDGNVGIGTGVGLPSSKLTVSGSIQMTSATPWLIFPSSAAIKWSGTNLQYAAGSGVHQFQDNIQLTGGSVLEIYNSDNTSRYRFDNNGVTGQSTLDLYNLTTATTVLKVTHDGSFGIGTTTPSEKLHVAGNVRITGAFYDSNNSPGTDGQILSSTTTGTDWVSLSEITGVDGTGAATQVTFWQDSDTVTGDDNFVWDGNTLTITGVLEATEKSFAIPHPTKEGYKLIYGVLEGPEHAVYCRGRIPKDGIIELPEEWAKLVDEDSITVQLTPIGKHQNLYVNDIYDNKVEVKNGDLLSSKTNAFYFIQGTRKDVKPLETLRKK